MRIRAFIALCHSVAVTRRIVEETERHKEPLAQAGMQVAWAPAANLHITLKFLGSVPEESLEAVVSVLERSIAQRAPFEVRARTLGAFPATGEPHILWVGADGGDPLAHLARDLESAMLELGFAKEERAYHPHVTVGRVKQAGGADWKSLWASDVDLGTSLMSELVLYESKTHSRGAEYIARARVSLGRERSKAESKATG